MPLLWGRPLTRGHAPSLGPNSSDANKLAAIPVEGPNLQAGTKGRRSFHTGIKRLFKGETKSKDTHSDASAEGPLQNTGQPLQLSSATESLPNTKTSKQSPPVELPGIPTTEPGIDPGQLEVSGHAQFARSNLESVMDGYTDIDARDHRRPTNIDERSGPLTIVMESSAGILANAKNAVINQPTMIDNSRVIHIEHTLFQGKTLLEVLCEEMTPGADLDSAARWPQPSCYPGTRIRLTTQIQTWFFNASREWEFLWLNGPAGVGKSAVAQTVAEYALENDILGAVYFFSRPNQRNKYIQVFITLAYQLSVRFPGYRVLVGAKLAAEPDLLTKTPRIQFRKLIVEPLLSLSHERKRIIILDGLDECDEEDNQLEIIELINHLLRSNISLPVIWVICSRPESYLKRIFARPDYAIQCWREFLPIDSEESRRDTEIFIRGRFKEIHERYGECVNEGADGSWPPETAIQQVVEKTSGLFVLADTLLRYIEDSETRDPDQRLGEVLALLEHSHITGSRNPMHDLDLFYSRILSSIPDDHWLITRRILVTSTFHTKRNQLAVQPLCNLLGISRAKFYAVMRRLHSVIHVPEPSDALLESLHFYHATFLDYLTNPNRAGRFFIGRIVTDGGSTVAAGLRDSVLSGIRCLGSIMGPARIQEAREEVRGDEGVCRSLEEVLSWSSGDVCANWEIAYAAVYGFRESFFPLLSLLLAQSELDDGVLGVLRHFDFNVLPLTMVDYDEPGSILNHLNKLKPSSLVRTQSISEWDQALLLKVVKQHPELKPLNFDNPYEDGFFFLGEGTNSVAVIWDNNFQYVFQKTPPQVWPVLQHTSILWSGS